MKRVLFGLFLQLCNLFVAAQGIDPACWLSSLDDDIPVSSLSVPGAHDAATGEGLCFVAGFGKTQALGLSAQWDCGVRAFDLRPALSNGELHIYHGPIKTEVSFDEALELLSDKLNQYPGDFAIVLLRNEGGEHGEWSSAVGKAVEKLGNKTAGFAPAMTVGDLRGKILFLSRDRYSGSDSGAYITGWSHSDKGTTGANIISCKDGSSASLNVQDYYDVSGSGGEEKKSAAVLSCLDISASAAEGVWTMNFLSGYSTTWLGCTPFATSAGYKRNAEHINSLVIDTLSVRKEDMPTGILFMDYAGVDEATGGIWHWNRFMVMGHSLVKCIIENNFR